MERKQLMKRITLLSSICITALLLTSCGGKTTPVITKSDPVAGIYLGGKLPGVSEEMMKDEKVSAKEVSKQISSTIGLAPDKQQEAMDRLTIAMNKYRRLSGKQNEKLDYLVQVGDISGYEVSGHSIVLYDYTGVEAFILNNKPKRQ